MSVVKHIDRAMNLCIRQWLSDEGMPKHQSLGLASGYTEVVHTYQEYLSPYDVEVLEQLTDEKLKEIHETALRKEEEHEK